MAAAPLESSSTTAPPRATPSRPSTTSPSNDPMDRNGIQETRKRPRLDTGGDACESKSISIDDKHPPLYALSHRHDDQEHPDPGVVQPASPFSDSRATSRVTINMKSPEPSATDPPAVSRPVDPNVSEELSTSTTNANPDPSTVSTSSSNTAPSPDIEVAELEDMDQDPSVSNWKSLEESLRDPEVVQINELAASLVDLFPRSSESAEPRESLEAIVSSIEKGMINEMRVRKCHADPELYAQVMPTMARTLRQSRSG